MKKILSSRIREKISQMVYEITSKLFANLKVPYVQSVELLHSKTYPFSNSAFEFEDYWFKWKW